MWAGWKRRGETQTQALFPAIQNILLACRGVGLGASLTTVHLADGPEIDAYLGLSEADAELRPAAHWLARRSPRPPAPGIRG